MGTRLLWFPRSENSELGHPAWEGSSDPGQAQTGRAMMAPIPLFTSPARSNFVMSTATMPRFSAETMAGVRKHIEGKLSEATIEQHPFDHLVIEDFFPAEVFDRLIEFSPFRRNAGVEWQTREASADVTSKTPYHARKQINFHADQDFEAPEDQLEFWAGLKRLWRPVARSGFHFTVHQGILPAASRAGLLHWPAHGRACPCIHVYLLAG